MTAKHWAALSVALMNVVLWVPLLRFAGVIVWLLAAWTGMMAFSRMAGIKVSYKPEERS